MDDSEVTLNVCLGKQFTGGELFFKGIRCEKHVNGETYPEVYKHLFLHIFFLDNIYIFKIYTLTGMF